MLTIIALVSPIFKGVAPDQNGMAGSAHFHSDVLSAVALDGKLLLLKSRVFYVVNIYGPILDLISHDTSQLPSKDIEWTLSLRNQWVQRSNFKPVKMAFCKDRRLSLLGWLHLKPAFDDF